MNIDLVLEACSLRLFEEYVEFLEAAAPEWRHDDPDLWDAWDDLAAWGWILAEGLLLPDHHPPDVLAEARETVRAALGLIKLIPANTPRGKDIKIGADLFATTFSAEPALRVLN